MAGLQTWDLQLWNAVGGTSKVAEVQNFCSQNWDGGSVEEPVKPLQKAEICSAARLGQELPLTETWEEEEEYVTASEDNAEPSAQRGAGDSAEVVPLLKKKENKSEAKKYTSFSGEQDTLPHQTAELPDTCVSPQEIQPPGCEGANPGASGDAPEGNRNLTHLGKEVGSPEEERLSLTEQGSTARVAAPVSRAAVPGDKVGDGTARGNVEWGRSAPDQLPAATAGSQAWGSSKELLPAGQEASPSGLPPAKGAPQSKPETKTSPGAQSLQAGKEPKQKGASSTVKHANTKEKNLTPHAKMPNMSEKTSWSQGAEAARKESAVAAADSPKNKKEQRNQKPVEKVKESSVSRNEGVTVHFHAILSKEFKLHRDTHKVFIRAQDIPSYADWKDNICELNCIRCLGEHGCLIEGVVTLSRKILDKYIPYKYWVKGDYEFIYKKSVSNNPVNRCLLINSRLLKNGGSPVDRVIQNKLAVGLTILVVVENCSVSVPKCDLADLCSLLCLDQMSPQDVQNETDHIKQAFAGVSNLKADLTDLCQRCIERDVDQWVWVLPLLHSFAAPLQQEHGLVEEDAWAGLEGLPFAETRRKQDRGTLLARMREKKYLVELDGTVVKSWLCVLPLWSLDDFIKDFCNDPLVILQGVLYRLENVGLSRDSSQEVVKILNTVLYALGEPPARALGVPSWQCCVSCCLRLHERLCKATRTVGLFLIPATAATLIAKVAQLQPPAVSGDAVEEVPMEELLSGALKETRAWFGKVLHHKLLEKYPEHVISFSSEPEVWDAFVKISFPDKNFTQKWRNALLADLKKRIQQEPPVNQILVYCSQHQDISKKDSSISQCFQSCAMEAVPAACQMQSNLLEQISAYDMGQFSQLVSAVMVNSWPARAGQSEGDFDTILHHLLTWPDVKHIFSFNGTNRNLLDKLTDEAKNVMAVADSVLKSVTDDIYSGCILVKHLEEVFQHQEQFLCLWETNCQQWPSKEKEQYQRGLKEVLELRHKEVTQLRKEKEEIGTFLRMCRGMQKPVRVVLGEVEFQHSVDLRSKRLKQVVMVGKRPLQTFYSLSPELKEFVQKMHFFKNSLVFQQFWEEAVEKVGEKYEHVSSEEDEEEIVPELGLNDILNSVIRPCFNSYEKLYDELASGSLTLFAVDRIFQRFRNDPEGLTAELNAICELRPAENRGWVDERVQQIQRYHGMNLSCEAAKIIDHVKESLGLSGDFSILKNLLHITEKLEPYKTQKLDSISHELMDTKKLLQEITVPRRSCLKEFAQQKEFVCWVREALKDINELKVFVDLASISAGENDMDVDRVACFHGAVHGYSSLLYELRQDSGFEDFMSCLPKLWRALDSDETLPKKLRASAQHLEWLKTVKESHGSVELSSLSLAAAINSRGVYVLRAPVAGQKVSLDSVLHFTLPATSGDTEASWKYSLAELRELQNKLMLMSAKGEQGLEVERFSEVFSNVQRLAQAFIDLYSAGNMLFRSWLAQVYCSPHRESCVLIDFSLGPVPVLEGQGDMAAVLPALCKTMESFLESWKRFMNARRREHFYLNYYSAEQLGPLCSALGRGRPSPGGPMMLSFLNPHCTKQDVLTALRSHGPPSSGKAVSDFQVLLDGERDLSSRLKRIWECYMSSMGSFLPSCLDIDTLGVWLKKLASSGRESVTRDFPEDLLCVGQPNLITCPRSDVLSSALAVYMNSPKQPLPTFDEVLLCTPQTSAEQVELFLHRCLIPCQGGDKIYTMLYADELSYDVSCRAEELFQHLQCYNSSYRLIILCNCERENSYLPSAFSHYRVHMIPQRSQEDIQQYLQHHFRVAHPSSSAASVFKECMCVGIVSSKRASMGKSLYVKRLHERLQKDQPECTELLKTIRLIEPEVDEDKVLKSLLPFLEREHQTKPMIFHFDITSSVQRGIPEFLFKLLVLQYLTDNNGNMWLRQKCHLYIIEILEVSPVPKTAARPKSVHQKYHFMDVFPKITCKSPKEVLEMETLENRSGDVGMDEEEFCSEAFQRPFQYLKRFDQGRDLDTFWYKALSVEGSHKECLQLFLLHCGVVDPSWAELRNFTWFLNIQLRDCEASVFCNPGCVGDILNGFKNFVVGFMILMARDFATPSLSISDQSSGRRSSHLENVAEEDLFPFRIRKKWESEPHPYLFFNGDRTSMTFIGFHFHRTRNHIDAINPLNGNVIKKNIMTAQLYQGLLLQGVPFNVPFDQLTRKEKLKRLCMVLGLPRVFDPDKTYELTTDNVLKILAIEMRFRCNIPVVIMGETGCGKTRLVKFLCQLRRGSAKVKNMKLVKVHGGTTAEMIYARIREAEALAKSNKEQHGLDTILFFDEANTTEAVGSIKEVLCDRTVQGQPLASGSGLRIIAACNPYRKHTDRMIKRLELAGLGYRVKADNTQEKLGSIPLRQLVYRVHALPPSMIPLVWDFGQLNNRMEKTYIQQIVQRMAEQLPMAKEEVRTVTEVLFASQKYMRQTDDECSFVSLRDVERCMEVFKWFYRHSHVDFLSTHVGAGAGPQTAFTEVTTFSRLLTSADAACLEREVQGKAQRPQILFLQQFDTEYSFLKCIRDFLDSTSGNKVLIVQTDFEDGSKDARLITSARYTVVNEINKVDLGEVSVFVYFIVKLSRLEGGTSYMGFHGGLWQSVHIDDLRRSKDMISDLTALQNLTISQLFSQDPDATRAAALPANGEAQQEEVEVGAPVPGAEHHEGEILDTTVLLRTCVQSAVGMLQDQNEDLSRSRRRIEILLGLFSKEDELKASFLKITKARLSSLLKKQEENSLHPKNWVLREASNLSALEEAGSFRDALWKRVQKVVTPFLALLVAIIDRNGNLELLVRSGANWVTKLWMFMFNDTKFLSSGKNSPQTEIIVVQNNMMVSADAGNEMPFSWRIKEYLEEMWLETQCIQNTEGHAEKFVEYFQNTALGKFMSALTGEERRLLFECYIRDFVVLTIGVSSQEQLQCLRVAFLSWVKEWMAESPWTKELVPSLAWAHLAHNQFKSHLQNFSRILAVYPCVTGYLLTPQECRIPCSEMDLDVLAAMACAEELKNLVRTASPELWLQRVKNLHTPIEFLCREEGAQHRGSHRHRLLRELRACWSCVFAMALFVEHILLGIHSVMPEFEDLMRKYTLLLAECFQQDSDMKSYPTFALVLTVLRKCKDEVSSRLYRHGLELCPICLQEPKDPVCLPCNHVFCHKCISLWLVPAQMYCPYCRVAVEDVELTVSEELRAAIAKKALFRQRCNNFFIDMVTTMCFKDNKPPEPEVIQSLLDLLFARRGTVLKDPNHPHPAVYTKFLSPFNDEVDETPIIRSVMLKLLLKYSFSEVKDDVQRYLSQVEHSKLLEKNDKKELYLLFVNCLEDSMCEKLEDSVGCGHGNSLPEDRGFPENYLPASSSGAPQEASVEYLQAVAEVRLCLSRAAELIFDLQQHKEPEQMKEKHRYLKNVEKFCSLARNDWHCVYLVRRIASQHGMEFAQKLVTEPQFSWVFPAEILQQVQDGQSNHIDRYLVCGERSRALRDAVGRAMMEGTAQGLLKAQEASSSPPALKSAHLLLAIFREVTVLYGNPSLRPKKQQTEVMTEFIQRSRVLNSLELQLLAVALVKNTLPGLAVKPQGRSQQGALVEMAVHMAAVLLCGHSPVLQPLRNLAFKPHTMQHSFLPTMPEDIVAQARTWEEIRDLHWYECANGHPCTVGECGRPMEKSRCPECHVPIGGRNHKPVEGFRLSRNRPDRTQTGHILADIEHRRTLGISDRGMSSTVFVLLRLLTHLSMLLGASRDPQSLGRMIKPTVNDVMSFLKQHIQEDLAQLTRSLGKSVDDTINILHLVLSSFLQAPQQQQDHGLVQFEILSTKEERNNWEEIVANTIIVPELQDLDKKLLKLNRRIQEDERISSNPIVKIVYGDPAAFLSQLPGDSHIHHSKMWSCRRRVSVENLSHVVQQKNAKDTVPLLWKFLQKESELRLVKFLPEILALQKDLVRQFQNTAEMKDCSIGEFLREPRSGVMRELLERRVNVFLSVWNKLRSSLDTNGEIKLPESYCDAELSLDNKLEVLLPRRQGLGLCSTALASYLIGLHNDFIYSVTRDTKEDDRYLVSPSEVADLHLISYEVERDLIPLILSNCQYSMEKGGETLQDFDLERIQQQVISKFLQGKPLIMLTGIPTLVYRHDRNYEQLFSDVKNNLEQSALPSSVMNIITGELQSYSDVCDALSLTDTTLRFLAITGENADMLLTEYLEQVLKMGGDQTNPQVLQALRRCQLRHSIALWQLLCSHKSEQLLRLGRDPFADVSSDYKEELTPELVKLLHIFLVHSRLETFLQELHEMIVLKLRSVQAVEEFKPTWSLKESLVPYLDAKDSELAVELEDTFPDEILLSHAAGTWKAAAVFKREHRDS
ncbi:E3 ubiquitin-protein ligase RNF213-like [Passer montanus]|uniref:E3 ubiquitin-protein ligase RNF213-like n=1 Tax=Passer montanus TaxID=9160 RepID=UPI00195F313A|nr:E3 ubiquitin-protein ligase RNF213-like [Passer montanus]